MEFQLLFCKGLTEPSHLEGVWELLCEVDKDFLPPLSARDTTFQRQLGHEETGDVLPHAYYREIIHQPVILAVQEGSGQVIGFMTFKYDYNCLELKDFSPSNYITTIGVKKEFRNYGMTRRFYEFIQSDQIPSELRMPYLSTRTWSTNGSHIHILTSLGFEISERLINHRGEGIDTLYFGKVIG